LKIEKEPKSIVVLDPCSADIISYMNYDVKIVGRSEEVDQQYLKVAPTMGASSTPSVQNIIDSGAEVVFADEKLNFSSENKLEEAGIPVVKMSIAETPKQLETNYHTIGRILGGNKTGDEKADVSYKKLISSMEERKEKAVAKSKNSLNTVCYLYYEDGGLRLMTSGTYGDMLLGYTGAVNVAVNIEENKVDVNTLKVANPGFIFYADDDTLKAIKGDSVLAKLAAVTGGKTMQISKSEMSRQGLTALETLEKMIGFINPELAVQKATEAAAQAATQAAEEEQKATQAATQSAQTAATQAATQPASQAATQAVESLASKYKIDLKDLSLKEEDDNDDVKAMQQRLFDLGYVSDKENITGYYGEISKKAVTEFQKKNGIKETGEADNATLVKIFSSDAKKADKAVDESSGDE
jgi:iron complex transport system substrate-binding protein